MNSNTWLVAGLGNPGPGYSRNRHNIGNMVVDELASRMGGKFKSHKTRAAVLEGRISLGGPRVVLAKPLTYMNLSGGPVSALARFYDIDPGHVVAVHDEIDIPFNTVKLKLGGGEGGHNGLRDISRALGTKDYLRVRVGVGRPPGRMDTADYVLKDFSGAEAKELPFLVGDAADAVEMLLADGLLAAQQKFHGAVS
ncbi:MULTISPECIES: aminoacyl-tRNA hydrolase [unclassified Arthrobacter]|uniref:aminoacyl-tRNA hydrolase n=1 Tax=unclassified Arthrobacter TaxID=235627 RepID=UPI001D154109|nr:MULTISPECIES: aminoacyl-tRNA hydrolase [unclassified Arthrobacter]MCC3280163.1 aminoacyl-tRNA hydrolase [Arthrobacter sp. zg-Y40]MCC9179033.1 aminoacyl-tRNA hydrolase [Arthrobacter sp. zg-Y750]MCC3277222.1 aminoacyl-tRNA hydrolase [Arthrobacter sp. zg-Y20]MDK1317382.1 aminoacyl-tRNA hydrolase [Arthrobacter sp. zg.Y20]MDK1328484.1 aminoacyl-tRNA hydrolase [Arthrobacter sp. zg-Y1143]